MMNHTNRLPSQIWILTLSAFAIGTAEFVIAGILPQVAESLGVSAGGAGNLITVYALAIVIGGPILTLWLARFDKKRVLMGLMGLFIVANLLSAFSDDYLILAISRVLAGLTQGAFLRHRRRGCHAHGARQDGRASGRSDVCRPHPCQRTQRSRWRLDRQQL